MRVFAVGPKLNLSWLETRETFRDKLFALADKRLRGPDKPLIQRGADDVASHLLGPEDPARPVETARDLVTLPEDIGLMAALVGQRGTTARQAPDLVTALAEVLAAYAPVSAYYLAKPGYAHLASRVPQARLLALALTDTFARIGVETFAEMADRYDVYLEAGVNMAQEWQVVCDDMQAFNTATPPRLPGGVKCAEQDPGKVAALRMPDEPDRDYAYESTTDRPSNMALVFDPDGRLISKQIKSYLTATEVPGQLDLVPGPVSGLTALDTPVGRLGFVTSKDAFSPDVTQKLDQYRLDILVQPEFFANDTIRTQGMWSADTLISSGYSAVIRYPGIESLVLPEMTGNIFEFSADAQQHIVVKPRSRRAALGGLVGQEPMPGFARVQEWVVPDPAHPGEPMAERRRRLGEAGEKLPAQGGGSPCDPPDVPGACTGGHVEGVLWMDLEVGEARRFRRFRGRRGRTVFGRSRPISRSRRAQRNVTLARRGRFAWAAFEERRRGRDQILLARSRDGGRSWSRAKRPIARPALAANEWWPSIAAGPRGEVWLAWQDDSSGVHRVYFARSRNRGRTFSAPQAVDGASPGASLQWKPSIATIGPGRAALAFIDERDTFDNTKEPCALADQLPQAGVWFTRIAGLAPEPARRLDGGTPNAAACSADNAWTPHVAVRGHRVLVSWLDFRTFDWDIWSRTSVDLGAAFGPERPVNDAPPVVPDPRLPPANEALNDSPQGTWTAQGPLVAFTDHRKRNEANLQPHQLYDIHVSAPDGRNSQVDSHGTRQRSAFSPSICALGRDALVAFQDAGLGQNDIRIVRMRGGSRRGRAHRVDDAARRGGNAWRPQLACWRRRVLAAWEDERDGPPQVYVARARAARIR